MNLLRKIGRALMLALFPVRLARGEYLPRDTFGPCVGFPVLGALLAGGALLGAGIAANRNRQDRQQIGQLNAQNQGYINDYANQYGGTFDAATQRSTTGANAYADAVGINGADGYTRATNAFQTGPGYQFALDQAQTAAERAASAGGYTASGNLALALQNNAIGMANQAWQSHLGNLAPYNTMEMQGLENRAGIGSQIVNARTGINSAQQDRLQAGVNNRMGMIGNLLGAAGNIAGRTNGFGIFGSP
jgi:hypothetical protein